jgi:hypothetical protein
MLIFVKYTLKNGQSDTICYDCCHLRKINIKKDIPKFLKNDNIDYESYEITQTLQPV